MNSRWNVSSAMRRAMPPSGVISQNTITVELCWCYEPWMTAGEQEKLPERLHDGAFVLTENSFLQVISEVSSGVNEHVNQDFNIVELVDDSSLSHKPLSEVVQPQAL